MVAFLAVQSLRGGSKQETPTLPIADPHELVEPLPRESRSWGLCWVGLPGQWLPLKKLENLQQRKVGYKRHGRAKSLAPSWQPLLEPWPWEPVLLDRVMLPAWSRRRAGCLPPPGQAGRPGRDQLCGCMQSMKRARAWQKSSTAAFYFYCFLQHVFLFPKQKRSVQDQWLYLSGKADFCTARDARKGAAFPHVHQPCLPHCLSGPVFNCKRVKNKWTWKHLRVQVYL